MASQSSAPPVEVPRFPMRRLWGTIEEVPDFREIPRDRWEEAMRTIPQHRRVRAVQGLGLPTEDVVPLVELAMSDLPPAPSDLARAAVMANPKLAPTPPRERVRSADRQVNFRITRDQYADLATAAELLGYSPSKLARELVCAGALRVIEEANRRDG